MQSAGGMCPLAKFVLQFARAEREISGAVASTGSSVTRIGLHEAHIPSLVCNPAPVVMQLAVCDATAAVQVASDGKRL
jgi:hypothetical protein